MKDMHNNISVVHGITPQAVGTTGAAGGKLSAVVDRKGFEAVEFLYSSGASASVADTITPVLLENDSSTTTTFTSVAAADLLGAETALTLTAAKSGKVGYRGSKRYVRARLYGVGTATAIVAGTFVLGNPHLAPTS